MAATTIICNGTISLTADGSAVCSTGWIAQVASVPFDSTMIDPVVATGMFAGGFVLAVTPWATAWGFHQMFKLLR